MKKFTHPALYNENDEPVVLYVVTRREVCPECNGYGTHTARHLDDSRLVDDMVEDGDDEGLESYYNGGYDVTCQHCKGERVIDSIDWNLFREKYPNEYLAINEYHEQARQDAAYAAQERRACGGW